MSDGWISLPGHGRRWLMKSGDPTALPRTLPPAPAPASRCVKFIRCALLYGSSDHNSKNLSSQTTGAAYLFVSNCVNFPQRAFLPCCRLPLIDDARNWWVKPSTIFIAACCGGYCPLNQWSLFGESHEKFKAWVQEGHCFIWKTSMLHFLWTDSIL